MFSDAEDYGKFLIALWASIVVGGHPLFLLSLLGWSHFTRKRLIINIEIWEEAVNTKSGPWETIHGALDHGD